MIAALVLMVAAVAPASASATFPGTNGMIVFSSKSDFSVPAYDLRIAYGDGELERAVTVTPSVSELRPAWSADGQRIAFDAIVSGNADVYTVGWDGTDTRRLTTNPADDVDAAWSPDGQRLVFASSRSGASALCLVNADGTGESCMTDSGGQPIQGRAPNWSPDGQRIAFESGGAIRTVRPDGSGLTQITTCCQHDPNWSPDGQKFVYLQDLPQFSREIRTINADGSGTPVTVVDSAYSPSDAGAWSPDGTQVAYGNGSAIYAISSAGGGTPTRVSDSLWTRYPDWGTLQLPDSVYPRPRGATPLRLPLVPAFEECADPNSAHGAPLSFPSCNPPVQASSSVTFGNDALGTQARFIGSLLLKVVQDDPDTAADEADVRIESRLTDVRCRVASSNCTGGELSDYTGTLVGQLTNLRITDDDTWSSTITDRFVFSFSIPCTPTADTGAGSTCSISTTADTLLPGMVVGGNRAVWQTPGFQVLDGTLDEQMLATDGLFVP